MTKRVAGSFRDPDGFVFRGDDDVVYRQINADYQNTYDHLMDSGLYGELVDRSLLIPHEEVEHPKIAKEGVYNIIRPEEIPLITYPFEWSFKQLKDAALVVLEVQEISLCYGMTLKDGNAFNVQFVDGEAVFIDTLSFERWEGQPWNGYRQFCEQFLGPLTLMSYRDCRFGKINRAFRDGLPLRTVSRMLPWRSMIWPSLLSHIHLHAWAQRSYGETTDFGAGEMDKKSILGVVESLKSAIRSLTYSFDDSAWSDYYSDTTYNEEAQEDKEEYVRKHVRERSPDTVWDMGANTGMYARIAASEGARVVAVDQDHDAVDVLYRKLDEAETILPVVMDIADPSPGLGWSNKERQPFLERGSPEMVLALALVHHLVFTHHVPLSQIAELFSELSDTVLVEFVSVEDPRVRAMMPEEDGSRLPYSRESFERQFKEYFSVIDRHDIQDSKRTLYLMERR